MFRNSRQDSPQRPATSSCIFLYGLLYLVLGFHSALLAATPENSSNFSFSADPGEVVLFVAYRGGMLGVEPSFTLYGDGRLQYRSQGFSGTLYEEYQFSLSYQEMEEILQLVVNHGLIDASREGIDRKLRQLRPSRDLPKVIDGSDMSIRISLESYGRDGKQLGAVSNEITINSPSALSRHYDIEELHGCAALEERMMQFWRLAKKGLSEELEDEL